ncbi:MAG: exodeoxyribonuclease VII small subunit [Bacillota bacterium]
MTKETMGAGNPECSFEEALERLEQIVKKLESETLTLSQAIELYEEGVRMSRLCARQLELAEGKIEKLLEKTDGSLARQPFEVD